MMKKLGVVLSLIFVLSFGSLVFAQNTNSSTTMTNTSSSTMTKGRRHGRRRARRHSRRRGRRGGSSMKTGNANK